MIFARYLFSTIVSLKSTTLSVFTSPYATVSSDIVVVVVIGFVMVVVEVIVVIGFVVVVVVVVVVTGSDS